MTKPNFLDQFLIFLALNKAYGNSRQDLFKSRSLLGFRKLFIKLLSLQSLKSLAVKDFNFPSNSYDRSRYVI